MTQLRDDDACACEEYNALSRRQFVTGAAGAAFALTGFPDWLPKVVLAQNYASNRDVIVSVFLRGGADGLSLCVPFGDANYYAGRPTIAIPRPDSSSANRATALDDFFGLPPAMTGLVPAYRAGHLLVAHATGQTNSSRSHFDAQRYMEVGKAADPTIFTGWLGRHLASVPPLRTDAPLRALGFSAGIQKTLVGAPKTLPIPDPANFNLGGSSATRDARAAFLRADYADDVDVVRAAALDAVNTVSLLQLVNVNAYRPANGATYPNSAFGRALRSTAALIKADVGIEAAQIDVGGWDTHSLQNPINGSMFRTMQDLSNALGAFWADVMSAGGAVGNVVVIAMSEFGRNARENGAQGTDHGRGSAMFAMGPGINGGRVLVNGWPGLAREQLEIGQDLKVTLDYRDVLAEIVRTRLGNTQVGYVFPDFTPTPRGVAKAFA
ncbi:MAG TPA: DUF1501 domain-containing protein [Gemmatimonadaceae bacterium]|nr:DUF1501 domain-containing protein [Gemmatimonadaceae bacterium]